MLQLVVRAAESNEKHYTTNFVHKGTSFELFLHLRVRQPTQISRHIDRLKIKTLYKKEN